MTHRHYGLQRTKPPTTDTGPAPGGALSGRAIVGGIVVILIVLGFIAYEVTKLVAHGGNTTTSTAAHDPRSNPSTADQLG